MASTQIQTLLHPADYALSVQRATKFLNDNFTTLDLVTKENTLENLLRTTESTAKSIQSEVRATRLPYRVKLIAVSLA